MNGHAIAEPYAAHIRTKREEMERLAAQRDQALATAYEVGQRLQSLQQHLDSLFKLQIEAHGLPPDGLYQVTKDLRLAAVERKDETAYG